MGAAQSLDRPLAASYHGAAGGAGGRTRPARRRPDRPRKELFMAHVVAEPCFDCKYTDCVVVCPVDCFYEGAQMLFIHPEECIDCEACVPECPVEAIFHEDNLPDDWKEFTALNAEESPKCPVINEKKDALEGESCTPAKK